MSQGLLGRVERLTGATRANVWVMDTHGLLWDLIRPLNLHRELHGAHACVKSRASERLCQRLLRRTCRRSNCDLIGNRVLTWAWNEWDFDETA